MPLYYTYGVFCISLLLLVCAFLLSYWTFYRGGLIKKSDIWYHTDNCTTYLLLRFLPSVRVLLLFNFVFLDIFIVYSMSPMQIHSVSHRPLVLWFFGFLFLCLVQCIYTLRLIRTVWVVRDWWRVWAYKQQPALTHFREQDFITILLFQTTMRLLHMAYSNETSAYTAKYTAKVIKSGNLPDITSAAFMQGIRAEKWDYPVHVLLNTHVSFFNFVWELLGFVS